MSLRPSTQSSFRFGNTRNYGVAQQRRSEAWLKDELSNVAVALGGARYPPPFADVLPDLATHCNRYSAAPCARSNSTMSA